MDDNPEVIRQQMDETRSNLAEKLEALESQVSDTVQTATAVVNNTVEAVKETVENVTETVKETVEAATETVHSVGQAFDLRLQTERHPWMVFGGAVAVGFTTAQLLGAATEKAREAAGDKVWRDRLPALEATSSQGNGHRTAEAPRPPERTTQAEEPRTGWLWDQLGRLKGLALGSLMGVVRDLAVRSFQGELGQRLGEEVDKLTSHLGAEPIHGPLFGPGKQGSSSEKECQEGAGRSAPG